jgi:hypothetical protein
MTPDDAVSHGQPKAGAPLALGGETDQRSVKYFYESGASSFTVMTVSVFSVISIWPFFSSVGGIDLDDDQAISCSLPFTIRGPLKKSVFYTFLKSEWLDKI